MELLSFTFPLVFAVGIVSSVYDVRKGIVPNMLIFYSFIAGLVIYSAAFFIARNTINLSFVLVTITNLLSSVALAVLLWKIRWWRGGDAKLFILYSLLIPVSVYSNGYIPYFPSLVLLMNVFIPFTIVSFFFMLRNATFPTASILTAAISVFSISWLSYFIPFPAAFLVIIFLSRILPTYFQIVIAVLRPFIDITIWNRAFLFHFIFWTMLLVGVKQFISANADTFVHRISPKEGDIIAEEIIINKRKLPKETVLTKMQANAIHHMVLTYDTVPFALYMFFGVIITLLSNGMFISLISFI